MKKLLDRTQKDIEEEQMLLNELKKIEARKKERDRKTQDLQKLISQADQVSISHRVLSRQKMGWLIFLFLYSLNFSRAIHRPRRTALANRTKRSTKRKCPAKYVRRALILL